MKEHEKLICESCNKEIIYPIFSGIQKTSFGFLHINECEHCGFNNWYEEKE